MFAGACRDACGSLVEQGYQLNAGFAPQAPVVARRLTSVGSSTWHIGAGGLQIPLAQIL